MEHIEGRIWKTWNSDKNSYEYRNFDHVKDQGSVWDLDFFYKEIYHFVDSEKNSCYEMWDCVIDPDSVVVDVGANVGFFTHGASMIAKRVISIEGSPENYSCLVENNRDRDNVDFCNAIVTGGTKEYKENLISSGSVWTKRLNPIDLTLEKIMDLYNIEKIDFLKIDIEGFEYDIFENLDHNILSRIDKISCEAHDPERNKNLFLPGKIRHTFYCNWGGNIQEMLYFVTHK
jgi:FkbM family methyltransferase